MKFSAWHDLFCLFRSGFSDGLQTNSHSYNSRWFCNKMPPTTVKNLEYFYPHSIQEISEVVFEKTLLCNICPRPSTDSTLYAIQFVCLLRLTQLTVINVCITDRKTALMISSRVHVKYQDSIQSLVAFLTAISAISMFALSFLWCITFRVWHRQVGPMCVTLRVSSLNY